MTYALLKIFLSAIIIWAASELAKRSTTAGALLISLPLSSLLAIVWTYLDSKDSIKIIALSWDIFYLVIPSLLFFVVLALLLKSNVQFWLALVLSCVCTSLGYAGFLMIKKYFLA